MARLKSASRHCDFGSTLNENLVEQFCIGINDIMIRDKLIDMPTSQQETFDGIVAKAQEAELKAPEVELNRSLSGLSVSGIKKTKMCSETS